MQKSLLNKIIKTINEEVIEHPNVEVKNIETAFNDGKVYLEFTCQHKAPEHKSVPMEEPETFWVGDATTQPKVMLTNNKNIPQPAPKAKEDYDAEINKYYGSHE